MRVPKRNPQQEYRLKLRERIEASPMLATKFPHLHGLKMVLEYYDAAGIGKNGEMKCQLNVAHVRSLLWFACRGTDCLEGDFDLSEALAKAAKDRHKVATGEICCQGKRKRGDHDLVPCRALLRYKLRLDYD